MTPKQIGRQIRALDKQLHALEKQDKEYVVEIQALRKKRGGNFRKQHVLMVRLTELDRLAVAGE